MVHEELPVEWSSVSFSKYLFFSGMILSHHDQGHLVFQKNLVVQSNIDIEAGDKCEQCCDWDGQDGQVGHLCCSHFVMCSPGALLTCLMLTCQCQGVSVWPGSQTELLHFRKQLRSCVCFNLILSWTLFILSRAHVSPHMRRNVYQILTGAWILQQGDI